MSERTCPACGVREQRTTDTYGRPTMNLDPITGKCVPCLIENAKAKAMPKQPEPFDSRAVAARNNE